MTKEEIERKSVSILNFGIKLMLMDIHINVVRKVNNSLWMHYYLTKTGHRNYNFIVLFIFHINVCFEFQKNLGNFTWYKHPQKTNTKNIYLNNFGIKFLLKFILHFAISFPIWPFHYQITNQFDLFTFKLIRKFSSLLLWQYFAQTILSKNNLCTLIIAFIIIFDFNIFHIDLAVFSTATSMCKNLGNLKNYQ